MKRRREVKSMKFSSIVLAFILIQFCSCTQQSSSFEEATLNYVDLSDAAIITAQPVITESIKLEKAESSDTSTIVVHMENVVNPALTGFGGAFNENGGEAFMSLPESERKALAEALFSPTKGAGFTLCRTAVGSSDFGLSAYSYSETAEDFEMEHFSVERDEASVIPFILAAKAENPDLKIFASPWSPPGWMKVSGIMDGGKQNPEDNILRADPAIYKAYGLYFSLYVQQYAKQGVFIDRLIVQNEPDMNPPYPGCDMLPEQMSELITDYIGPQFEKDKLTTEIWAGTFRNHRSDAQNFMKLENASDAAGVGLQYCKAPVMEELQAKHPEMPLMHTEGVCYNGKNSMDQARKRFAEIAGYINLGVENYCYWNMVLNETSRSAWNWKQNSLINIDRNTGVVTYNPDFAPVSLMSRYFRPGDKSLQVETPEGETAIAVSNDDRLVVFVQNDGDSAKAQKLNLEGKVYTATLPAQSLCALVFNK